MHTNESKEKKERTEQEERKQEAQIGSNCRTRIECKSVLVWYIYKP